MKNVVDRRVESLYIKNTEWLFRKKYCITDNEMARKDLKHQNTAYYITEWLFLNLINSRKGERKVWQEKN